jgi:hypothetical protein
VTLLDALATALRTVRAKEYDPTKTWHETFGDAILSDPAFRAALVESIAEALHESSRVGAGPCRLPDGHHDRAAAIVARMLDPRP